MCVCVCVPACMGLKKVSFTRVLPSRLGVHLIYDDACPLWWSLRRKDSLIFCRRRHCHHQHFSFPLPTVHLFLIIPYYRASMESELLHSCLLKCWYLFLNDTQCRIQRQSQEAAAFATVRSKREQIQKDQLVFVEINIWFFEWMSSCQVLLQTTTVIFTIFFSFMLYSLVVSNSVGHSCRRTEWRIQ